MQNIKAIYSLLKKDLVLELRMQYSFYGIFLYIASTIFILYLTIQSPSNSTWNGLFWVIQLFICINAVAKSFLGESKGRLLYYYTVCNPIHFILAKIIFNTILMAIMGMISLLLYSLFLGNPLEQAGLFIFLVLLGGWSFTLIFTFLSALVASANQNAAIMAVLGFPLIIPQILLLVKISKAGLVPLFTVKFTDVALLVTLDFLIIMLSVILFPLMWKD